MICIVIDLLILLMLWGILQSKPWDDDNHVWFFISAVIFALGLIALPGAWLLCLK